MAKFPSTAKRSFGPPPTIDQTNDNLSAPEVAPAAPEPPKVVQGPDRRAKKKTGRTILFSTRVSEEFDRTFRETAERDNLLLTRLLELCLEAYRKQHGDA